MKNMEGSATKHHRNETLATERRSGGNSGGRKKRREKGRKGGEMGSKGRGG